MTATLLPVAGNLVTGDALYCQRDYCQQIRDAGGDYLVIVKRNQRELYDDIALAFAAPVRGGQYRKARTRNRHGDRWEIRELSATDALNDYLDWPDVGQVCRITRRALGRGQTATESRYAITSLDGKVGPKAMLRHIRGHWEIENRLHYVRDVTLGEDASRVRKGAAPAGNGDSAQHRAERAASCRGKQHRGGLAAHRLDPRTIPAHPRPRQPLENRKTLC